MASTGGRVHWARCHGDVNIPKNRRKWMPKNPQNSWEETCAGWRSSDRPRRCKRRGGGRFTAGRAATSAGGDAPQIASNINADYDVTSPCWWPSTFYSHRAVSGAAPVPNSCRRRWCRRRPCRPSRWSFDREMAPPAAELLQSSASVASAAIRFCVGPIRIPVTETTSQASRTTNDAGVIGVPPLAKWLLLGANNATTRRATSRAVFFYL